MNHIREISKKKKKKKRKEKKKKDSYQARHHLYV